jgi:hypothetical protein
MSPAYCTDEQFERWFKKTCARCGRHGFFATQGPIVLCQNLTDQVDTLRLRQRGRRRDHHGR